MLESVGYKFERKFGGSEGEIFVENRCEFNNLISKSRNDGDDLINREIRELNLWRLAFWCVCFIGNCSGMFGNYVILYEEEKEMKSN